jgi:hypothetical protein
MWKVGVDDLEIQRETQKKIVLLGLRHRDSDEIGRLG